MVCIQYNLYELESRSSRTDFINMFSNSYDDSVVQGYPEVDSFRELNVSLGPECFLSEKSVESRESDSESLPSIGEMQKPRGNCFYYDPPLLEDTGVWIPISVPPMSESDHEEWAKGFHLNGGCFPEEELGYSQCFGGEKELTMWDVMVEMLTAARGRVGSLGSIGNNGCRLSWMSSHMLEQAWSELEHSLTEANFGNVREILEAEPPRWLSDSSAASCMLCGVRFHPIMCSRHHCRFCGGIFCGDCSKGRSLLPVKFRVADPQRVCDVCNVRLESVQPYLMDKVSNAAQLPTHDLTDLSTLRSWVNFPWGQSMEYEIYKATNTIRAYNKVSIQVSSMPPAISFGLCFRSWNI